MEQQSTIWQTLGSRTAYDSPWVRVDLTDVQTPHGNRFEHHVVHLPRVAIALIVNEQNEVLMLWRHRFITGQWGYELLGGLVEETESPVETAAREAIEESGWRPLGDPQPLLTFEPLPGQVTARIETFCWRRAEQIGPPADPDEVGRIEWIPLDRIPNLAQQGSLLGAGTLVPLLFYLTL